MKHRFLFPILAALLFVFFAAACFYNLGKFTFWHDEGNTALLARSILQHGLPYAFFDNLWITEANGTESTATHLWFFTPWLPFYAAALGFKLFGLNELGGRFPFALAGFLSSFLLFAVVWRATKSRITTLLALFFYVTNATTLIYTRQCKYYPFLLLGFLMAFYGMILWRENKKGFFWSAIGFLIMFHCNYLTAGFVFLSLGLYAWLCDEGKELRPLFLRTLMVVSVLFAPFMLLATMKARSGVVGHWPTLIEYFKKMGTHFYYWNNQVFPMLTALLFFWKRPAFFKWIGWTVLVSWILLPLLAQDVLRYTIHLLPLFCFLSAFLCAALYQKKPVLGLAFFCLIGITPVLQNFPDALAQRSFAPLTARNDWTALKNYYFKEYEDPMRRLVPLVEKAGTGSFVYLNQDQMVWEWYSSLPLAYLGTANKISAKNPPLAASWTSPQGIDWWMGPHLNRQEYGPYLSMEEIIGLWKKEGRTYEIIETGIPVTNWDLNSPIRYKHFLDRFSDHPSDKGTIKVVHRLERVGNL